ncbi:uncharacterized protein [Triticum aestivum]|uniref:uncharacterized protein n=1 Tax=Triticum aestivum TaxID=4565 RepID=UPI001D02962B|nr:uncharacterized protein LOC123156804 [Triticum aestivum]
MVDGGSISSWIESCQEAGAWARCTGGCSPPLPCGAADTDISGWVTDRGLSGWATTPAAGAIPMDSGTTRNIQVIEGTSIHITWVAMKDVFPSQVDKCVEIGLPELILMVAFSQVLQIKLYMQLMGLHDSHFNISSWKPLSVSMNNCCWSVARLHFLVGYFLPGVVEEFSEAWFVLRATFSLSFY